jgi:endoglucanase
MSRARLVPITLALALALVLAAGVTPPAALAGVANAGLPGAPADPLAGMPWGNYTGPQDEVFPAYRAATGTTRRLLGLIALRPRMRWFGAWYGDDQAESTIQQYLQNVTGGDPRRLAQVAVFRLDPWEGDACRRLPTAAEQASYRRWIGAVAAGIGGARVAMVLQPDLPFELCVPHRSRLPMQLVAYAARVFSALPHTTLYIDAGASDWPTVSQAVQMLRQAGVSYTRGFALGATHYASTAEEIRFGAAIVAALAAAGIPNRHFVINTAQNGRPFTYQQLHDPAIFDNAPACRTRSSQRCVTLGIPPTAEVASPRWRLPAAERRLAARWVDAYLWIGRPWLENQSDPFDLRRSLQLAATTPF